jgi:hypothetical protein
VLSLGLIAVAGVLAAAVGLSSGPDLRKVAAGLGWPLPYVQSASKWAKRRGVPLEWVLATIIVESRGNPRAAGDSGGRSVGLMQVNTVAHAAEMASAGVSRDRMFNPDTNIEWGTKYLSEFKNDVLKNLGGRTPPIPLDWIVRLAYKGPATVYSALRRGESPANISWAPDALANWRAAMSKVQSLTRGKLTS